MSEPLTTALMPLYALASWYGLVAQGHSGKYILPVALVGWIWAAINILRTKRLDLGVVTFFFVILAALAERKYGFGRGTKGALVASSILVAGNYSLVVMFWKGISKDIARSHTKSQLWLKVFWGYCACMTVHWVGAAVRTALRTGETEYGRVGSEA